MHACHDREWPDCMSPFPHGIDHLCNSLLDSSSRNSYRCLYCKLWYRKLYLFNQHAYFNVYIIFKMVSYSTSAFSVFKTWLFSVFVFSELTHKTIIFHMTLYYYILPKSEEWSCEISFQFLHRWILVILNADLSMEATWCHSLFVWRKYEIKRMSSIDHDNTN